MASKKGGSTGGGNEGTTSSSSPTDGGATRNSVRQARPRVRASTAEAEVNTEKRRRNVNSIRPVRERQAAPPKPVEVDKKVPPDAEAKKLKQSEQREESDRVPKPESNADAVPEPIRKRFVQVGRKYYFPDGTRAFTDRGHRLTTASENTEVIKSLVSIAEARGWRELAVQGTERFRREAWFAAKMAGLQVRGYRATEFEQGRLVRMMGERSRTTTTSPESAASRPLNSAQNLNASQEEHRASDELLSGRLVDHGRATYKHDPKEQMSYYVKLETERGERVIWGVDLERAFRQSLTQPKLGELVGLRAGHADAVKVKANRRDAEGKIVGEKDLETHRNRWILEKRAFFDERAEAAKTVLNPKITPKAAVKAHPQLTGTYLQMRAAELLAQKMPDLQDRKRFVSAVRSALADTIARGEPLPPVRLKDKAPSRPAPRKAPEQAPARG